MRTSTGLAALASVGAVACFAAMFSQDLPGAQAFFVAGIAFCVIAAGAAYARGRGAPDQGLPSTGVSKSTRIRALVAVVFLGVIAWYYLGGGLQRQAESNLAGMKASVAVDFENQYNIAARSGTAIDRCVQAGLVAAAYLQAQNEAAYSRWKATETRDCAAAGAPR